MRSRRPLVAALLFGTLLTLGCDDSTDAGRLHRARLLWQSNRVSEYRYTVATSCFCLVTGPIEANVRNGTIVSWSRTDGGPVTNLTFTLTVDSLFAYVERAMNRSESSVTVEYDPALGYPTHVNIDWIKNAVDDEVAYQVLSLTILQRQ